MTIVASSPIDNRVGLRQLRAQLSDYVEAVKTGRSFILTDHGTAVAQLVPLEGLSTFEKLLAQGVIQPPTHQQIEFDPPIKTAGTVSDLVAEQRR